MGPIEEDDLVAHLQPAYRTLGIAHGRLLVAERLQDEVLSLPIGTHLADADVIDVVDAVASWPRAARGS